MCLKDFLTPYELRGNYKENKWGCCAEDPSCLEIKSNKLATLSPNTISPDDLLPYTQVNQAPPPHPKTEHLLF